ncbi:efflux RND transporter permease subunit [Paracoccus sp. R12_1]|uniref:efflux RND transporter permease subunit n=1 Tax=unclassified Paracoccus (in: a-proteobacteria) TaxID=2688777 RepID=UPI001ADA3015|nr:MULTISPECIES: efflux RND transporter permease subunit [unclassified Paracoccus (in: a-proteobacteria)]MBO9453594.1 efflux RND transporter permease subunit [Paracoccus sp. R12_2]MBO9486982.1 efflux RND transporter permease subunit [Paracoccus sp. R12_1]
MAEGRGLLSVFARHRTLANLVMAVMVVGGLYAAPQLRAQFFPDTVVQEIDVRVQWDGAGPEDVDNSIIAVLEPALMGVEGVALTTSRAVQGSGRIEVEFEPGWDMSRAKSDVETAISGAGDLPEGAEDPEIERSTWRDRVADVVISGPVGLDQLTRIADDFVNRLYAEGITRLSLTGIAAPEVLVEVRMADLVRHDITLEQIATVVGAAASVSPAGDVASGASRVRTGVETRDPAAVSGLLLTALPDGTQLTVGDVADVGLSGMDRNTAYYVDGQPAVMVQVQRSASGDAIGMQRSVEEVVRQMQPTLPQGVGVELVRARAELIAARLELLLDNAVVGLGLVLALLFLFLNARTALWVAAGIPASLLAAVGLMYAAGMTLNMISLFALILTLGIIVDDAIVVGEHADYRARKLGEPAVVAAERAAGRMAAPVVSSSLTTIIAFTALMAIGGRFGDMIADIPMTVILVLIASLVECFLVLPNHMSHALTRAARRNWYDRPSRVVNRGLDWLVGHVLRPLMVWVLRLRYPVLAGTVVLFSWSVSALMTGQVPWRFFDAPEQGSVAGNFAMLPGATRDDTIRVMHMVQAAVDDVAAEYEAEYGVNPVTHAMTMVGSNSGRPLPGSDTKDADLLGAVQLELIDPDFRPYSSFDFVAALQRAMPSDPRLEAISFRGFMSGPGGDAISVRMTGAEAQRLKDAAEALKLRLSAFPEVSALEDSMSYDKDELGLQLTPQGKALGFTTETLARELRQRLAGIEAATYPVGTRTGAIRVELPEDERRGDFLDRMMMRTSSGQWVPLGDIVTVGTEAGFSIIRRENGERMISVTGDISGDDPSRAAQITTLLQSEILPAVAAEYGINYQTTGLAEQERDFLGDAALGFGLALTGIYMVLAWIFASWSRPFVVMSVIPFGLVGAVWGHHLWALPMSMFSIVGLLGMSGIIINDSIVLISTIDEYARDRGLRPAIVDAVCNRFRPVLLTTATTVLGLAPLLYERSSQALFLKPTVVTLAYGLGFGMIVVLLVVPAVLGIGADIGRSRQGFGRGLRAPALRGPVRLGTGLAGLSFLAVLLPATLLPALGVGLPQWFPVAPTIWAALGWYACALLAVVLVTGAVSLAGRSPASRPRHQRGPA